MVLYYKIEGVNSSGKHIRETVEVNLFRGETIEKIINQNNLLIEKKIFLFTDTAINAVKSILSSDKSVLSDEELYEFLLALKDAYETEMSQQELFDFLLDIFPGKKMQKIIGSLYEKVTLNGTPLFRALEEEGFPTYVSSSIEVGSESGQINLVLEKLLSLVKTKIETIQMLKKMAREPKIISTFLIGYFFFSMFYFIPKSKPLLSYSDRAKWGDLTIYLIDWSDFANEEPLTFVIYTFLVLLVVFYIFKFLLKFLMIIIPFLRRIKTNQEISLLFSVLTVSSYSNVLLQDGIRQATSIITNDKLKVHLSNAADAIEIGESFSSQLEKINFEKRVISLVKAGETVSKFGQYFEKIANKYKDETQNSIEIAMAFIKPATLIFAASVLITIYYGVNAPLINFGNVTG